MDYQIRPTNDTQQIQAQWDFHQIYFIAAQEKRCSRACSSLEETQSTPELHFKIFYLFEATLVVKIQLTVPCKQLYASDGSTNWKLSAVDRSLLSKK